MRIEVNVSNANTSEDVGPVSPVTPTIPSVSDPMVSTLIKNSASKFSFEANTSQSSTHSPSSSSSSNNHLHHGPVKMPVKIANIMTSQHLVDKLHHQSKQISCTAHACVGSIMAGQSKGNTSARSKEEILDQAVDFFEQYFKQNKKPRPEDLARRLAELANELERTGTYTLSNEELHFGAKTAWRNSARCIGRIQWNKLEIQDARHVKTTKEMFDAVCVHLREATNNGNLKSMITVFPQRQTGRDDFRVWSPQLISFAGYLQADGTVIGDPSKVQLTKVCQRLGWTGKGGRFDVLPIILSAPGEGPKYYDIPEELVIRVNIEHPTFPWFKELGLQWYALPAVSDMMFDCAGLQFTAAPFNGWYMGTEVGARDFCDPQRYNITQDVAIRMGLDTSNLSNLWKDQVMLEVNVAVLYSFQKNNVTMVDHHTASEQFIKHMHNEYRSRGGCPADWVWIVPPMSSSLTSVYHQEMLNYNLKPSYEYQEKAWLNHQWANSNIKLKYRFTSVAKAAWLASVLMGKVLTKRVKATILYATETGKSETFANKLGRLLHLSFYAQVQTMDD